MVFNLVLVKIARYYNNNNGNINCKGDDCRETGLLFKVGEDKRDHYRSLSPPFHFTADIEREREEECVFEQACMLQFPILTSAFY